MDAKLNLKKKEREYLRAFKKSGGLSLREFNRATILLFLDKGLAISEIENLLEVDRTTIWRIN
jgi:DNA invertase Pin-like site-specific DNA recombinase